jgi:hypothetical protein
MDRAEATLEALFAAAPIRSLTLVGSELRPWYEDDDPGHARHARLLVALLDRPCVAAVRDLDLMCYPLAAAAGARALAATPHLAGLRGLCLAAKGLGDEVVAALGEGPSLRALRRLDLDSNNIGDGGARALAASQALSSIQRLLLKFNAIGDDGAAARAASPHLAGLRHLDLRGNRGIGLRGAEAVRRRWPTARLDF